LEVDTNIEAELSAKTEVLRAKVGPKMANNKVTGGTIGVSKSNDIPEMQGKTYEGESGSIKKPWPWKEKEHIRSISDVSGKHAEEDLVNQMDQDLIKAGRPPDEIEGTIHMHIEQKVCSDCSSGLSLKSKAARLGPNDEYGGVLYRFSKKYPKIEIIVSNDENPHLVLEINDGIGELKERK